MRRDEYDSPRPNASVADFVAGSEGDGAVLELAHSQQLKLITHEDIARFWRAHYSDALDLHQRKTVESNVVCFLHLFQAAELGSLTVGKRGQPARMRIDIEELDEFIISRWDSWMTETVVRPELRPLRSSPANHLPWAAGRLRVCLSARPAQPNAAQLQSLLRLVGIDSELLERGTNATLTMSESAFEIMRRSEAGLFVVTSDHLLHICGRRIVVGNRVTIDQGLTQL